jgi:hypothetical protein
MAYYVAALPVIYYGTSYTANQLLNTTKQYLCEKVDLVDDSSPVISAAKQIVHMHAHVDEKHHAYQSKVFVEDGIEMLEFESTCAQARNAKWRMLRKDFKRTNQRIARLTRNLEQRMRLFLQIVSLPSEQRA